jgi:serine beta-lactamase-like protein LACTB, mitochondrial
MVKNLCRLFIPLLGALVRPAQATAQAYVLPEPAYLSAIIHGRNALSTLRETANIPGLSVAVGIGGKVVWSEGIGYADLDKNIPAGPRTQYRIASVSKLLTAAVVGKMVEQGKLDLDADVRKYVPDWPDKCYNISSRQLAGHLGGIREYRTTDFTVKNIDAKRYNNAKEALSIFVEDSLVAPPGTRYNYTSLGYTLLEAALEGASGESFLRYMKRNVLQPLGMHSTLPNHPDSTITRLSALYGRDSKGANKLIRNLRPTYKFAGGGYISTAEDLVRFGMAHLKPGFLKAETLELLFRTQHLNDGTPTGVGIGWVNDQDPWGRRLYFHNGNQPGARPVLIVYPDHDLVIAMTTNVTGVPEWVEGAAMAIADPFLRTMAGETALPPSQEDFSYHWRSGDAADSLSGSLTLIPAPPNGTGYYGWMDTPQGVWPVADVIIWPTETVALAATPKGLFPLRWNNGPEPEKTGFMTLFQQQKPKTFALYLQPAFNAD